MGLSRKIIRGDTVYYFLPASRISTLKDVYKKYRWKFPELTFTSAYVKYRYIPDGLCTFFLSLYFILKNFILGTCFFDDNLRNIKRKLIDFDDLEIIPRRKYLLFGFLGLIEFKITHKLFRKYYIKKYAYKGTILNFDPLIVKYSNHYIILYDSDFNIDSLLPLNDDYKNYIKEGLFFNLLMEYAR